MFGFAMVFVEVGPVVLRVFCLLVRRGTFGWSAWVGVALVPIELVGTAFVGGTVFVLVHLALNLVVGTVFAGVWLVGRTLFAERTPFVPAFVQRTTFVRRTTFDRASGQRAPERCPCGYEDLRACSGQGQPTSGHRQTRSGDPRTRLGPGDVEQASRLGGQGRGSASPVEW
jgi:hypothetical protein